jgi:hypothetical protein
MVYLIFLYFAEAIHPPIMQKLFSGGHAQDMLQRFYAIQGVLSSIEREREREICSQAI